MRYLVIVSYGRTGSTVPQAALNATDGVLIRGENHGCLRGLHFIYEALNLTRTRFGRGPTGPAHPWFGSEKWNRDAFLSAQRELATSQVLRPQGDTEVIGFKEIRYTPLEFSDSASMVDYLEYLAMLFPGARFLVNRRDPETTARSGWWPACPDALQHLRTAHQWLTELPDELNRSIGPETAIPLDYETWSGAPEELEKVWHLLDLPWSARVVETLGRRLRH